MAYQITNPTEKLLYYRKAADEAERSATAAADPDVRMAYLAIMRTWIYLAEQLERETALEAGPDSMIDQSDDDMFVPAREKRSAHRSR